LVGREAANSRQSGRLAARDSSSHEASSSQCASSTITTTGDTSCSSRAHRLSTSLRRRRSDPTALETLEALEALEALVEALVGALGALEASLEVLLEVLVLALTLAVLAVLLPCFGMEAEALPMLPWEEVPESVPMEFSDMRETRAATAANPRRAGDGGGSEGSSMVNSTSEQRGELSSESPETRETRVLCVSRPLPRSILAALLAAADATAARADGSMDAMMMPSSALAPTLCNIASMPPNSFVSLATSWSAARNGEWTLNECPYTLRYRTPALLQIHLARRISEDLPAPGSPSMR